MRRLVVACCVAVACTSTPGGSVPVAAPTPRALTFRPDTVHYLLTGQRRVEQEVQGQTNQQVSALSAWISTMLTPLAADTLAARIVLDSVATTGNVFAAGDLSGIRGTAWTGRLAPSGELLDMTGPRAPGLASQMFTSLSQFYPRLPAMGVTAGAAWVDTVTSDVDVGGVELTIVTVNAYDAVGLQPWGAGEAFLVRVVSDYTLAGQGSQSGQPLTLEGRGRRHTREYLAPDGRYLGNTLADTSSYDITLTSLGIAIPGRQWRHDTLRVLR